jgi:hypothetical protein
MPVIGTGSAVDLADLCRSAGLSFLANARDWDKRMLAEWLECRYRSLVVGASERARSKREAASEAPSVPPETLTQILNAAHADVLRQLRQLVAAPSSLDAGRAFISTNVVTRCIDDTGVSGWAPIAHRSSRLADRVMSLFAADFLVRPWDYEYDLTICKDCETVSFADEGCCRARSGTQLVAARVVVAIAKAS